MGLAKNRTWVTIARDDFTEAADWLIEHKCYLGFTLEAFHEKCQEIHLEIEIRRGIGEKMRLGFPPGDENIAMLCKLTWGIGE